MQTISMHDVARALAHCDPRQLAAALAEAGSQPLCRVVDALAVASDLVASFPRDEVIEQADALLYEVLRWPVADSVPGWESMITPDDYAARRGITLHEARTVLDHLTATEADAARQLLAAGHITNFTLEQAQVTDCIHTLMLDGTPPTRGNVRTLALNSAHAAMRPGDGTEPIVYSPGDSLAPRVMSPSPKVHALLWLNRLESTPPTVGIIADRIAYLRSATHALGSGAREHARVLSLRKGSAASVELSPEVARTPLVIGLVS